ncbi:unnamed protein product [Calicophoron daubneyi]|uniref:Uncharacterized protein n=2 Tax=Calicophoron daubneyi TaxID=300641 RepID=A0AAV2T654_CALDB
MRRRNSYNNEEWETSIPEQYCYQPIAPCPSLTRGCCFFLYSGESLHKGYEQLVNPAILKNSIEQWRLETIFTPAVRTKRISDVYPLIDVVEDNGRSQVMLEWSEIHPPDFVAEKFLTVEVVGYPDSMEQHSMQVKQCYSDTDDGAVLDVCHYYQTYQTIRNLVEVLTKIKSQFWNYDLDTVSSIKNLLEIPDSAQTVVSNLSSTSKMNSFWSVGNPDAAIHWCFRAYWGMA